MNEGRLYEWSISLRELCDGKREGPLLVTPKICKLWLLKWTSVFTGTPLWGENGGALP